MSTNIADIWKYDLRRGNTDHPANGACLFDAGMWLVYGRIGDEPPCSCPVIRRYGIGLNDNMDDEQRQLLKPFILRIVGNRDPAAEPERLHYIVLETARQVVPLALERWPEHQTALRGLPDGASFNQIKKVCKNAAAEVAADDADGSASASASAYATYTSADAASASASADAAYTSASTYAADAAEVAATYATYTSAAAVWPIAISILDGALRIGRQSPEFDEAEVRRSVEAFGRAMAAPFIEAYAGAGSGETE